jgi:3-deoxy-D-manno-octulosonic-acid transferase
MVGHPKNITTTKMRLLYNFAIWLYTSSISVAAIFSSKAALWVRGRRGLWKQLQSKISQDDPWIWMHCASLGEFEQGRPLLEKIKNEAPHLKILLTFFSPSGYQIRKNYPGADLVTYLPADYSSNARKFLDITKPCMAIFVKYEFWFNYLNELHSRKIPTFLVSGIFRPQQHFFKFYGSFFRKRLHAFTHFYLQNEASVYLLQQIGFQNVTLSGDTRFDRVIHQARHFEELPEIKSFAADHKVIVGGSVWPADLKIILPFIEKHTDLKFILVPHEPEHGLVLRLKNQIGTGAILWSELTDAKPENYRVLIIDTIGLLSRLYYYCHVAYIGGGFGAGIHNILEAAVYGKPVVFGPNYQKFTEAVELIKSGGALSVKSKEEFEQAIGYFLQPQNQEEAKQICRQYVSRKSGATSIIVSDLLTTLSIRR